MLSTILLVFAFVFAVIAAFFAAEWPWRTGGRPLVAHFGWLAVAFWILSILLGGLGIR